MTNNVTQVGHKIRLYRISTTSDPFRFLRKGFTIIIGFLQNLIEGNIHFRYLDISNVI